MKNLLTTVALALVLISVALPAASVRASPDLYYDNFDAAQAKEYGDAWIDAVSLEVDGNGTHLRVVIRMAASMPTTSSHQVSGYIAYLDTDSDGNYEYAVDLGLRGDGFAYRFRLCDTTVSPPSCTDLPAESPDFTKEVYRPPRSAHGDLVCPCFIVFGPSQNSRRMPMKPRFR